MPDDSTPTSPETPPPYDPRRRVGTGLAGETTRNEDSTVRRDAPQRPLEIIGDFEVLAKLGQGGMGAVYRARQISLDRQVALKVLPSRFEGDPDYVSRFQREARVAASLSHPNLVKVYAAGLADGCHYIAMELIEGETLGQWIKREALPPLEALRIILDVAHALECGWRMAQLIHRDIKPGNIFLSIEGDVKLGDLGLAKIVGGDSTGLTHTGTAMGTPHYISPEQARGDRDLDFRADIYSLGCTLYQMLTRQTPYSGHEPMVVMNQHINSAPPAILKVMPQCPLPLGRLVSKMLRKQRRERPASYEELIAALESVRAQLDPSFAATIMATRTPSAPDPAQVGMPLRGVQSEASPTDAEKGRPGGATLPAKSKLPLYGGASVLVLAVAAFLLWPKEEKLTKAQIYAREHASGPQIGEESASPASDGVAAPTSGSVGDDKASPSSATKDAPFMNTLGMKFVPVSIIGGPTGGQRVLFSVWDTRVQDYGVFANETKREWPKADFEQGPTHPAVNVSWEDAQAFCAWLTERERKAGKLGANEMYRLPSDHEWSCGVGIGEKEDATKLPNEKNDKIAGVYPWGTQWPPPVGAGNYCGEETQAEVELGQKGFKGHKVLVGYKDGYVWTSPAGSFAANRFGLYDIGGNVYQWCEDWFDKDQKDRVLRGASWGDYYRGNLLSSMRNHNVPGTRGTPYGFRPVLASATSAPPGILSTASYPHPRVWIDDTEYVRSRLKDGSLVADGEWLVAAKTLYATVGGSRTFRDSAVRVVFSNDISVRVRVPDKERPGKEYWASAWPRPHISLFDPAANKFAPLNGEVETATAYAPEVTHELVFAAQGDQLRLWLDGKEAASVRDSTQTEGKMGLVFFKDTRPAPRIKKVEYGELEAVGTSQAPSTPTDPQIAAAFPPGQWVKAIPDLSKLPNLAEFKDGWARLSDKEPDHHIYKPESGIPAVFRNAGIRVRRQVPAQWHPWHGGTNVLVVRNTGGDGSKKPRMFDLMYFGPKSEGSQGTLAIYDYRWDLLPPNPTDAQNWAAYQKLAGKEIPPIGTEFTAELFAVGSTLVGRINDQTVTCSVDDGDKIGHLTVTGTNRMPFRDLEVLNLDGLSEAEALKLAGVSATSVTPSPALPASPSSTPTPASPRAAKLPDPAKWVPAFNTPESLAKSKVAEWTKDGIHLNGDLYIDGAVVSDVAVRAKVRLGGSQTSFITGGRRSVVIRPNFSGILLQKMKGKDYINMGNFRLAPSAATSQEIAVEFVVVGKVLMASVDGKVVGSVLDDEEHVAGKVALYSGGGYLRDIAWQSLDGPPTPSTPAAAAARLSPSAEPWQDVLHDPARINLYGAVERTPEGLRFTDYGYATRGDSQGPKRDGAVRMLATFGGIHPQLLARQSEASGQYSLYARSDKVIVLGRYEISGKQWTVLHEFSLREPLQPGQDYEIELRVVGQTLIAKFDGVVLGTVTDGIFPEGNFGLGVTNRVTDKNAAPALVKALEVLDLDAPAKTTGK